MLGGYSITLLQILMIAVPCTLLGVLAGSLYAMRMGVELGDDTEYRRRLQSGECSDVHIVTQAVGSVRKALTAIAVFLTAMIGIVLFGSVESWRPTFDVSGELATMQMSHIIEILMLSASALILLLTHSNGVDAVRGSVFSSGMQAVVAIFGIAWMGDTFIASNIAELRLWIEEYVTRMPWLFGLALFTMSIMLYSQAATVRALLPLGIALGLSPWMLIALFPAVNGYFFFPNYPTVVAAISFDRTGTTRIGSFILNHSFMLPGLIATGVSVGLGLLLVRLIV
jgi:anaerobic C4-dicarboxylate transporter DcuA/anaerobic C4-dicarboxylate transporter DcuB